LVENSEVESPVSLSLDSLSPPSTRPILKTTLEGVVDAPYKLTINLADLKNKCLRASCRRNTKWARENWSHNPTEKKVYLQGVPIEVFRLVKNPLNIRRGRNITACLWCKDSDGNPTLFHAMYDPSSSFSPLALEEDPKQWSICVELVNFNDL
jgi:hypothetical protein